MALPGLPTNPNQVRCHASSCSNMSRSTGASWRRPWRCQAGRVSGLLAKIASAWPRNASLVFGARRWERCLGSLDLPTSTRRRVQRARSRCTSHPLHGGFSSSGWVCCAGGPRRARAWARLCRAWASSQATVSSPRRSCPTSGRSRALASPSPPCSGDLTRTSTAGAQTQCFIAARSSRADRLPTCVAATFCMGYAWAP